MGHTEVIVRDAEIEEGTGISLDLYAAFVELFGTVYVAVLELLCALFETTHGFCLCRIRSCGVGRDGSGPS